MALVTVADRERREEEGKLENISMVVNVSKRACSTFKVISWAIKFAEISLKK